jgi:hypothetical protein
MRRIGTYSMDMKRTHYATDGATQFYEMRLTENATDLLRLSVPDGEGQSAKTVVLVRDDTAKGEDLPEGGPLCFAGIGVDGRVAWTQRAPDGLDDVWFSRLSESWQEAFRTFLA